MVRDIGGVRIGVLDLRKEEGGEGDAGGSGRVTGGVGGQKLRDVRR